MPFLDHVDQAAPIAIYDSGVGGMAIARRIKSILPQESIHYIRDSKKFPYGGKTKALLCGYVAQVINFCLNNHYKLLIIACNTATAAAIHFLPAYLKTMAKKIAVLNVVDPVIEHLSIINSYNQLAIIATHYTIRDGIYKQQLQATGLSIFALETPHLASMVVAYFCRGGVDHLLLNHYLGQLPGQVIDALLPACTHYLFLENALGEFFKTHYQREVVVIDVAGLTALAVQRFLATHNLLNHSGKALSDCFMVTKLTPALQRASKELFGVDAMVVDLTG